MFRCLFYFKQKTAYEMRISDWSSDVCSSDLIEHAVIAGDATVAGLHADDGDDVFGGYAGVRGHALQGVAVAQVEVAAAFDAGVGHEDRAVVSPAAYFFRRARHRVEIGRASGRGSVCL